MGESGERGGCEVVSGRGWRCEGGFWARPPAFLVLFLSPLFRSPAPSLSHHPRDPHRTHHPKPSPAPLGLDEPCREPQHVRSVLHELIPIELGGLGDEAVHALHLITLAANAVPVGGHRGLGDLE